MTSMQLSSFNKRQILSLGFLCPCGNEAKLKAILTGIKQQNLVVTAYNTSLKETIP